MQLAQAESLCFLPLVLFLGIRLLLTLHQIRKQMWHVAAATEHLRQIWSGLCRSERHLSQQLLVAVAAAVAVQAQQIVAWLWLCRRRNRRPLQK